MPALASSLRHNLLRGAETDFSGRRVCLFATYDPQDVVDPHVLHYLAALRAEGFAIVLISSSARIDVSAEIAALCEIVLHRANEGFDFAGWALATQLFPSVWSADELLLANDSVYAPIGALAPMFARMRAAGDVWGVTESVEVRRHLQSYFLLFRRSALASEALRAFWRGVEVLPEKWDVTTRYEIPLLSVIEQAGLMVGALVKHAMLPQPFDNPTLQRWREVLAAGAPFLKVQLLRDNPHGLDLDDWPEVVYSYGCDPRLITQHLMRVAPPPELF